MSADCNAYNVCTRNAERAIEPVKTGVSADELQNLNRKFASVLNCKKFRCSIAGVLVLCRLNETDALQSDCDATVNDPS